MNPTIKQQWLAALRSGTYPQGRHALHPGETYCCLGVLCDLYRQAQGDGPETWEAREAGEEILFQYQNCGITLPAHILQWAGLDGCDGTVLAEQNDHGASFDQIAEYIEAQH